MAADLNPVIEAQALDETQGALRDLVQTALNIGLKPAQMQMMLRSAASDLEPNIIVPGTETKQ